MNVLVTITGLGLKDEEMVKLDMHILPPISNYENDWKAMCEKSKPATFVDLAASPEIKTRANGTRWLKLNCTTT